MVLTGTAPVRSELRADDLRTKAETARAFVAQASPRVIAVAVVVALAARLAAGGAGGWGWADLVVLAATAVLVGPVEWVIHLYLLHAPEESWRMRVLKTGTGHREHHLDPPAVGWLLLGGVDAAVFAVLIAAWTALWSLPVAAAVAALTGGGGLLGPFLTALVCAYVSLGHYEWTHLLVHTRYRPRSRYYRRLARNHRLHHYRNEYYWLGVTSNLGDRIMGTLPATKTDVPLSDTARTLG